MKKTIGQFLCELRKEKGLTQREVAEKLNVSDKTVSHWECDENSPDLSVIPLLAELYDVSCDEILKGEKKQAENKESEQAFPTSYPIIISDTSEKEKSGQKAYFSHRNLCITADLAAIAIFIAVLATMNVELFFMPVSEQSRIIIGLVVSISIFIIANVSSRLNLSKNLCDCYDEMKFRKKGNLICLIPIILIITLLSFVSLVYLSASVKSTHIEYATATVVSVSPNDADVFYDTSAVLGENESESIPQSGEISIFESN